MTRRLRLETLSSDVAEAKRRAALHQRWRPAVSAPKPPVSELLRDVSPGSEKEAQLGLRWLAETYPAVMSGPPVPFAPKLHRIVDAAAKEAGFSDRARDIIRARVASRNERPVVRRMIAKPGAHWRGLDGAPLRPITDAERAKGASS